MERFQIELRGRNDREATAMPREMPAVRVQEKLEWVGPW